MKPRSTILGLVSHLFPRLYYYYYGGLEEEAATTDRRSSGGAAAAVAVVKASYPNAWLSGLPDPRFGDAMPVLLQVKREERKLTS